MTSGNRTIAIIVAAGNGSRVGGEVPKQFRMVAGQPMLRHSYEALALHVGIDQVVVVVGAGQEDMALESISSLPAPILVQGGATRRDSVRNALEAIAKQSAPDVVLIHDAARPFLTARVIDDLIEALAIYQGAVPALPVVDSIARGMDIMGPTVERDALNRIQTPQAFRFADILAAHRDWDDAVEASDDARMLMQHGGTVALVKGNERLAKFTFAEDFMEQKPVTIRTGSGFDVHRLVAGEDLWLCGVKIEHSHGLLGHSDADVAMHALTDAILGALALGDIGDHFPPSDPQWRGASSDRFLTYAIGLAADKGYHLSNADITIICEAPKIGPHRTAMRERLAHIIGVDIDRISVKATTTEMLGFTGRGEGIAAQAVVCLAK